MDSTLFKTKQTTQTAADTRIYFPNSNMDQSYISRQNQTGGRLMIPKHIQQSMFMKQPMTTVYDGVCVYCPVCKREYSNSQVDMHAMVHDSSYNYDFVVRNASTGGAVGSARLSQDQTKSKATLDGSQATTVSNSVQYPLVQPLEFWTKQLNQTPKSDIFVFKDNKNYDKVDKTLFIPKQIKTATTYDSATQTFRRPPLQYESNQTNLYNCLDNAVNTGHGPTFSMADLTKSNKIVTPKRELDDWELMQKMQTATQYMKPRTSAQV